MPKFSKTSLEKLQTCDNQLIQLFNNVILWMDCTIICGHRGEEEQNFAYVHGQSKLKYPKSKHNSAPSKAVDVAPCINGKLSWDEKQCTFLAGFVKGIAATMGIKIRWGGDWSNDNDLSDNQFDDYVHFEIVE
jgi:peptidoglycan L-alanyl-D-glutamate endopeptidase CwlK